MNNDLIRRADALKELTNVCCYNGDFMKKGIGSLVRYDEVAYRLHQIPAVDAVEVVRCKDCESGLGRFLNCDGDVEGVWCDR